MIEEILHVTIAPSTYDHGELAPTWVPSPSYVKPLSGHINF